MENNHRVKIKKGDLEIEIESSDKNYLNEKLKELLDHQFHFKPSSENIDNGSKPHKGKKSTSKASSKNNSTSSNDDSIDISGLFEFIKDQEEYEQVEKKILNNRDRLPKTLMCFYYAEKFLDSPFIRTGHVETLTDQFGAKIRQPNISLTIKKNLKYFAQDQVRKKGAMMSYKINRAGKQAYEKFITEEES